MYNVHFGNHFLFVLALRTIGHKLIYIDQSAYIVFVSKVNYRYGNKIAVQKGDID